MKNHHEKARRRIEIQDGKRMVEDGEKEEEEIGLWD
jgi:hypothetical protein